MPNPAAPASRHGRHVRRRDAADRQHQRARRQHRAHRLQHGRARASAGNSLSASAPAASSANASVGRGEAGAGEHPVRLGGADHAGVGVRHDDQPAADRGDLAHLRRRHHRAGADQRRSPKRGARRRMLSIGSRRVERHLDDRDAGRLQRRRRSPPPRSGARRAGSPPAGSGPARPQVGVVSSMRKLPDQRRGRARPASAASIARRRRRMRRSRAAYSAHSAARADQLHAAARRRGSAARTSWPISRPERYEAGLGLGQRADEPERAHAEQVVQQVRPARPSAPRRASKAAGSVRRRPRIMRPRMVWPRSARERLAGQVGREAGDAAAAQPHPFRVRAGQADAGAARRARSSTPATCVSSPRITSGMPAASRPTGRARCARRPPSNGTATSAARELGRAGGAGDVGRLAPALAAADHAAQQHASLAVREPVADQRRAAPSSKPPSRHRHDAARRRAAGRSIAPPASRRQARKLLVPQSMPIMQAAMAASFYHSATLPSAWRQIGLRQRWPMPAPFARRAPRRPRCRGPARAGSRTKPSS